MSPDEQDPNYSDDNLSQEVVRRDQTTTVRKTRRKSDITDTTHKKIKNKNDKTFFLCF
jgi:hypothetical protein